MGQLFKDGGLTTPNSALMSPGGQPSFVGSPQQVLSRANAGLPSISQMEGNDPLNPQSDPSATANLPKIGTPSFLQAANTGPAGMPSAASPGLSKLGKLGVLLTSGAQGALAGRGAQEQTIAQSGGHRAGGIGTGFEAGYTLPFLRAQQTQQVERGQAETQLAQSQAKFAPQIAALGAGKTISEIQKNQADTGKASAEAGKASAEAGAVPFKTALDQAQTEAANYKDDPNLGLIDLRTKQPVSGNASFAPLSEQEAAILGKQPGESVPLKLKNTANEMVNRGIRTVQANGHSLLVDGQGNTIKDMGAATPLVVMQNQLGAAGNPNSPEFQTTVDAVGQGKMDLQTAVGRMGRFPGAAFSLMSEIEKKYPNYFQGNYESAKKVLENFTSGGYSQNLNAIETAREHMATFKQLAGDLNNGKVRAFNTLGNALKTQFGSDSATNLNIAKQFFSGEVGKAVVNGGGTAGERDKLADAISTASSWTQLSGALGTADQLLAGKQKALKDTFKSGMGGTPNFGGGQQNPQQQQTGVTVTDPRGVVHSFPNQQAADGFRKAAGMQ
jgi:hypothetical protein